MLLSSICICLGLKSHLHWKCISWFYKVPKLFLMALMGAEKELRKTCSTWSPYGFKSGSFIQERNGVNGPEADFHRCSVLSFMIRGKWWGQLVARTFMLWEKENIQLWLGYQALFDPKYILKIIQKWIIAKSKNLRIFIAANFQSWHFWSLHFDGIFKESLLWSAEAKDKRSLLPILLLLLCRRLLLTWRSNHLLLF